MNISLETRVMALSLTEYAHGHRIPPRLLLEPDHMGLEAVDIDDFGDRVRGLSEHAEDQIYDEVEGRFVASIKTMGGISLGNYGHIHWLQIAEPRTPVSAHPGPRHVSFVYEDLEQARVQLRKRGITRFQEGENPAYPLHSWLSLVMDAHGHELRLNNMPLEDVVTDKAA